MHLFYRSPAIIATIFRRAQEVLGLEYKADYNGLRYDNLSSHENNMFLNVNGWNSAGHRFDPHDLWHERLHAVLSTDSINRPVDEGCAYLYGDSWGFTWPEIQAKFKKYVEDNPRADWLSLYISGENFVPGPKIMKISYMLNALIVQKIERERGFTAVMKLLGCGKKQTGDENFFNALQAICGINKGNFNDSIQTLIKLQ